MKKAISIIGASLLLAVTSVQAQMFGTNSFFSSAEAYLTSFNTNSTTFQTESGSLWTAVVYQNGINFADDLGLDYYIPGTKFYGESTTRNAGIAGTIVSQQGGFGYSIVHYDTKVSIGLNGGYDFNVGRPVLTGYIDLRKALTDNTFAGLRLGYETDFNQASMQQAPQVSVIVGFKF